MVGLKENVIIGKLIPAGTGSFMSDSFKLDYEEEEEEEVEDENSESLEVIGSISEKLKDTKK